MREELGAIRAFWNAREKIIERVGSGFWNRRSKWKRDMEVVIELFEREPAQEDNQEAQEMYDRKVMTG